jgi:tetratricopeptide (TPR) repeat protein
LRISENRHSVDKQSNIQILNDLGNVYGYIGNNSRKLELLSKALDLSEKYFGRNHMITAQTLTNIGDAYGYLGDYEKQKDSLLRSLDIK